jgi:hypothetical protein
VMGEKGCTEVRGAPLGCLDRNLARISSNPAIWTVN